MHGLQNRVEAQVEPVVEETPAAEMASDAPADTLADTPVEPLVAEAVPVETFGAATPAEAAPAADAPPAVEPEPVPTGRSPRRSPANGSKVPPSRRRASRRSSRRGHPPKFRRRTTLPRCIPKATCRRKPSPPLPAIRPRRRSPMSWSRRLGGDDAVEQRETRERRRRNPIRQYKIQEVIKRRQILLVQVVKEERGNKGAALTTYLSLAGRYCVLMPNAGRGGGISRKISNPADRKRMKEVLGELDVPQGMGVILRTAGLERATTDIKRDYEYLSRLWDSIRELTMRSTAPALIYEEGDLIKRSLRDVYDTDIAQVLVEGEAGFTAASEFMRQLVPHQASKVELYKEPIPLFHRYQVESQFDAMHSPVVQLRSGGYIVINPTEALVAIDVNSGRSTKERNIEETALRTNIEASEEVARQVRLRDLAGLIVIDFIDMEETRHQRQVEHKVKDAMRNDRARIQIGRISAFGLLEMSRQRLRPSLLEHSTEICPHCAGTGRIRSIEFGRAACAARRRGGRRAPPRRRDHGERAAQRRALPAEPEAPHADRDREALRLLGVDRGRRRTARRRLRDRARARRSRGDRDRPAQELARASYDETSSEARPMADEADPLDDREPARTRRASAAANGRARLAKKKMAAAVVGVAAGGAPVATAKATARVPIGPRPHARSPRARSAQRPTTVPMAARTARRRTTTTIRTTSRVSGVSRRGFCRGAPAEGGHAEGAHAEGERNGDGDRRRRRGRRGGRRRRRENGEGEAGDHAPREQGYSEPRERVSRRRAEWRRIARCATA